MNPKHNVVFLDTETTGLNPQLDQIWDVAWCFRDFETLTETWYQFYVQHDTGRAKSLPPEYLADYQERYRPDEAVSRAQIGWLLADTIKPAKGGPAPLLVGSNPQFDTRRLEGTFVEGRVEAPWLYKPFDVEAAVSGYLLGRAKAKNNRYQPDAGILNSNALSRALGVEPANFNRHTGHGDVAWARAQFDRLFAGTEYAIDPVDQDEWSVRYGGVLRADHTVNPKAGFKALAKTEEVH